MVVQSYKMKFALWPWIDEWLGSKQKNPIWGPPLNLNGTNKSRGGNTLVGELRYSYIDFVVLSMTMTLTNEYYIHYGMQCDSRSRIVVKPNILSILELPPANLPSNTPTLSEFNFQLWAVQQYQAEKNKGQQIWDKNPHL